MLIRPATSLIGVNSGSRPRSSASVSYAIEVAPLVSIASVSWRSAAKWKYVKSACPLRISGHSAGIGSFTLTIMSARSKISSGPLGHLAALLEIVVVGDPRPQPGPRLHQYLVPPPHQFLHTDRQHGHAVFVQLDLFRYTDDHE